MLDTRHLFTRNRTDLPPPEHSAKETEVLEDTFRQLSNECKRTSSPVTENQLVGDFSSNKLTLPHVEQLADWLEGSSLRLYALDLSFNRIYSPTWQPVLDVLDRLCVKVDLVNMGGNYLPALEETAELKKVQQLRRVSLALPASGGPLTDWQREWTSIALEFGQKAYDPAEEDRSVSSKHTLALCTAHFCHGFQCYFAGQVKGLL